METGVSSLMCCYLIIVERSSYGSRNVDLKHGGKVSKSLRHRDTPMTCPNIATKLHMRMGIREKKWSGQDGFHFPIFS